MRAKVTFNAGAPTPKKKSYQTPTIKTLGSVRKLTLKTGSNVDGLGGFM